MRNKYQRKGYQKILLLKERLNPSRILQKEVRAVEVAVLKRRHPRPRLDLLDKLFWVVVRRFWSGCSNPSLRSRSKPWCVGTGGIPFVLEADLQGQEVRRKGSCILNIYR